MNERPLTLELLPGGFAVARLEAAGELPQWARGDALVSITRTESELSVVCPETSVPARVRAQRGFRALRVAGSLDFAETGILASLAEPLARAGVSIFALSTYDTDYLLLPAAGLERGLAALAGAGHAIRRTGQ